MNIAALLYLRAFGFRLLLSYVCRVISHFLSTLMRVNKTTGNYSSLAKPSRDLRGSARLYDELTGSVQIYW
jgi:hypothetical protein